MQLAGVAGWKKTEGSPFDPWRNMRRELGAKVMRIAPKALTVESSVTQWEQWAGICFEKGGEYIVDGALQPVLIDRANNYGRYEDPNLWILHPLHHTANPANLS